MKIVNELWSEVDLLNLHERLLTINEQQASIVSELSYRLFGSGYDPIPSCAIYTLKELKEKTVEAIDELERLGKEELEDEDDWLAYEAVRKWCYDNR